MTDKKTCDCGLDLSSISYKSPNIQVRCLHDGSVGLSLHPEDNFIKVRPGDALEVRWRLVYPSDGGPPTLSEIGFNDEHRTTEARDNHRADGATGSSGTTDGPSTLDSFASEGAGTGVEVPDGFAKLIGYRAWLMTDDDGLRSTAHQTIWDPDRPTVASCQQFRSGHHISWDLFKARQELYLVPEGDRASVQARLDQAIMNARRSPERNCMCGLYAVTDPKNLGARVTQRAGLVYGRIKVWGKVAEYTEGYRAEIAEIDALFLPRGWLKRRKVRRIAKRYGVGVEKSPKEVPSSIDSMPIGFTGFWLGFVAVGIWGLTYGAVGLLAAMVAYFAAVLVGAAVLDRVRG